MKLWAKICHDEGVLYQRKFETEAEANAFIDGCKMLLKHAFPDDEAPDDIHLLTDDTPAEDE